LLHEGEWTIHQLYRSPARVHPLLGIQIHWDWITFTFITIPGNQMNAARFILVLCLVLQGLPSVVAAEIDDSRWIDLAIPAAAPAIGRLDVKALLRTPLVRSMRQSRRSMYTRMDTYLRDAFGFRTKQLDYFWYVFPGPEGISLLQGDFNVKKVIKRMSRMENKSVPHDGVLHVSTFNNASGQMQMAALLRPNLIAVGAVEPMQDMLKQWQTGGTGEMREGVVQVIESAAHIAAAYIDMGVFQAANPAYALIRSASMEGMVDEDIHMTLYASSSDEQITQGLAQVALGILRALSGREGVSSQPVTMAALDNARVSRKDATLVIESKVEGDLILSGMTGNGRRFSGSE
jgi:hypothetical protein